MIYKFHKNGSYNIHTIKTDKFKTIKMEIIFRNNIDKSSIARRTLLFELLMENSHDYQTKRDLILKLEELYNATCYSVSSRVGNQIVSSVSMDFLNPNLTNDDYLEEAISLPFSLIFNPNTIDNEFNDETLETIKNRMKSELASIKEDPRRLSLFNALNKMDSSSISSTNIIGSEEEIDSITESNLYDEYTKVLEHDYIDIFIIGDIDENKCIDLINKHAKFNTIKNHELNLFVDNKVRSKTNKVNETIDLSQSQIVYIYNTVNLTEYERKYAMQIYNMILGGGSLETKLYQNLRGKNSLCYNISSIYNKYDNLMLVSTAVDADNIDKAKRLIELSVDEMIKNVTEEELNRAISSCIASINLSIDDEGRIIDNYLFSYMAELDSIDERIANYKKVSIESVCKVAKKIKLNTIYVLEGTNHEEN